MSVIIDTGCANINSLKFALERLTDDVIVSADPEIIRSADRVLLPGVGSAAFAMESLRSRELVAVIQNLKQPVLGICLGMQLLMTHSEEGEISCLDMIPGNVKALRTEGLRLPHMGWNTLSVINPHPLFNQVPADEYFYFVHSYGVEPAEPSIAQCKYGAPFAAAVSHDNFMGVQFHPERSGEMGARILKNFLEISR